LPALFPKRPYFSLRYIVKEAKNMISTAPVRPRRTLRAKYGKDVIAWCIMLPSLALFVFYVWLPLVQSIRLSVYETQGMRPINFVGLANFKAVFEHPDFWPAVRNTFLYTLWSLVIGFLIPIVLAVLIQEMVHGKSAFRVAIYLPNIVPGLATVFLWRYLFKSGDNGGLNMLLSAVGLPGGVWLSNASLAIPVIVVAMTWKGAGATALIYLAGLQGINPELYEAAIIDGANVRQRIAHITVPQIYNLGRTLLILQVIAVFQVLYEPLVMTNGGPNNASISLMQLVFRYAFDKFDYPKAAAVSVIISVALVTLTLIYNKVNKPRDM
jgi:multiple sugar transport system permease protein